MPHSLDLQQARARNVPGGVAAGGDGQQRIARAVNDQCRRADPCEFRAAVAGGKDREQLPRRARRVIAAAGHALAHAAQKPWIRREARAADYAEQTDEVRDDGIDVAGVRPAQERAQCTRSCRARRAGCRSRP